MSQENMDLVDVLIPEGYGHRPLFRDERWLRADARRPGSVPDGRTSRMPGRSCPVRRGRMRVVEGLRKNWLDWLEAWSAYRVTIEERIDLGDGSSSWPGLRDGARTGRRGPDDAAALLTFRDGKAGTVGGLRRAGRAPWMPRGCPRSGAPRLGSVIATTEYELLTEDAGVVERPGRAVLLLEGGEAAEFLQGQVTNDVEALEPGQGCYAALLDHKGKLRADMRVLRLGPESAPGRRRGDRARGASPQLRDLQPRPRRARHATSPTSAPSPR